MKICSDDHDEIMFDGGYGNYAPCPLCEANKKIKELEKGIETLHGTH